MGDICLYNSDGTPKSEQYLFGDLKERGGGSFDFCNGKIFSRITIVGSRFSINKYYIFKHNRDGAAFPGLLLPGLLFPLDTYLTSTFEKDGGMSTLASVEDWGRNFTVTAEPTSIDPVAGKALFSYNGNDARSAYQTFYCVDSDCNQLNKYGEQYNVDPELGLAILDPEIDEVSVEQFYRESLKKVNEETWMAGFSQAFIDYNVPTPESALPILNVTAFTQPFDPTTPATVPECFTLACPTEDDWKSVDPAFGKTPYIEPNGILTGGFIAGITIASIVIAVAIFSYVFKRGLEAREKRVKAAVLKSIAKSMTVTMSKNLSPRELEDMFKKIDTDGNGSISKDEVKGLVDEAGVANMSERDYNILFDSIDLDENGTLDFAEFCAFFTSIASSDDSGSDFIRASILHAGNCAEV